MTANKRFPLSRVLIIIAVSIFSLCIIRMFIISYLLMSGATVESAGYRWVSGLSLKHQLVATVRGCLNPSSLQNLDLEEEDIPAFDFPDRFVELTLNYEFDDTQTVLSLQHELIQIGFKSDIDFKFRSSQAKSFRHADGSELTFHRSKTGDKLKISLGYPSTKKSQTLSQLLFTCVP